ncbi:MAG: hypothetical protein GWN09_08545 [Gammaproteobacteria bacterium]|nr:hypothetical protein [Gammaproteobacteria bacterium]
MMKEAHKLYSQASDACREYAEINRRAWARLAQIQLELAGFGLESATRQLRILGEARTPADFWAAESELWAEYGGRVNESCRQTVEVISERREQVMACVERHATRPESAPRQRKSAA